MDALDSVWLVPDDLPAFDGHFDGNPIVPGVVLLDQALLRAQTLQCRNEALWSVAQTKFINPVGPGELLAFHLEVVRPGAIRFEILSGDRMIACGTFLMQEL